MYFLHAINSDRQTRLLNVLGQIAMILGDKKILYECTLNHSRAGSSVGIATELRAGRSGIESDGDEIFRPSRPALVPTQNTTITTHNRTLRSPHTTEHYDHHTQQNTTITTHKGSRLLISTETRYQLQPNDKELHTEHTPLRTIILH